MNTRIRALVIAAVTTVAVAAGGLTAANASTATPAALSVRPDHRQAGYPRLAAQWAAAWNSGDGKRLAALFSDDAVYTDNAFQATWTGRDQIAQWVTLTTGSIAKPAVHVESVFGQGDRMAIVWTFTGQIKGALTPFAVPVTTVLTLCAGKFTTNVDTYNLAAVLQQSGLPADAKLGQPS